MRLNNQIREAILENAIEKSGIRKRAEELIAERVEIAEKLRRSIISEEFEKKVEEFLAMFEDVKKVLPSVSMYNVRDNEVSINFQGQRYDLKFNGSHHRLLSAGLVELRNEIKKVTKYNRSVTVANDFGIFDNDQKCNELCEEYISLKMDIKAVLDKCSTDTQLLKIWPESSELIPSEVKRTGTALMVNTSKLNSALGLPSETPAK